MKARGVALGFAALGAVWACGAVESTPGPDAPINDCPANPCGAYAQSGAQPLCVAGACIVGEQPSNVVLLISLPEDSYYSPGRTIVVALEDLLTQAEAQPPATCLTPCATLPAYGVVQGQYIAMPQQWQQPPPLGVAWNLGNSMNTALPVTATYRLMWPPGSPAAVDANLLGLPVGTVQAASHSDNFGIPGPAGGPSVVYETYLPPGTYERNLQPIAPFNQAFPPEVKTVTVTEEPSTDAADLNFDLTQETGQGSGLTIPVFNITSGNGSLIGWTAYLRDASRQVISNVVPLGGASNPNVVLATNHVPVGVDALSDAVLVIAPPDSAPFPTAIFAPVGNVLPSDELYPSLPSPVTVTGSLVDPSGNPVVADLVFEALAITLASGVSNTTNFEFVRWASASLVPSLGDAGVAGPSSYSVDLPPGQYRVTVRPLTPTSAVLIASPFVVDPADAPGDPNDNRDFALQALPTVRGSAVVADGRPLAGAIVEAAPVGCTEGTSQWCLPRAGQTTTTAAGLFVLPLDPGEYIFRIRPADGSRLPWVVQPLTVPTDVGTVDIGPVNVPAPLSAGLTLLDPSSSPGNPIVHAVVRAFWLPAEGSAVELGRAITAADGRYEMYLTLPAQ